MCLLMVKKRMSLQLLVLLAFIMDLTSSFISILVGCQAFKGYKPLQLKVFFIYTGVL